MKRFLDGEKLSAKEVANDYWKDTAFEVSRGRAYTTLLQVKKWMMRAGISFGSDPATALYQVLDETNVIRASDRRIHSLQSWIKTVQQEIDVGMETFGSDPAIRNFFELAVTDIQQALIDSRRKSLKLPLLSPSLPDETLDVIAPENTSRPQPAPLEV